MPQSTNAPYIVLRLKEANGKFVGYDPNRLFEADEPGTIVDAAIHLSQVNPGAIFGVFARTLEGSFLCADWYRDGAPL